MDNSGLQYFDKSVCEKECQLAGGNLTSIHSPEENDFLASILRSSKSNFGEQTTMIGNTTLYFSKLSIYTAGAELLGNALMWTDGTAWDFSNWHEGEHNPH